MLTMGSAVMLTMGSAAMLTIGSATMGLAPLELGAQAKLLDFDNLEVKPMAFISLRASLFLFLVSPIFSLTSGMKVSILCAYFSLVWV